MTIERTYESTGKEIREKIGNEIKVLKNRDEGSGLALRTDRNEGGREGVEKMFCTTETAG
jgi:hypothetical protein